MKIYIAGPFFQGKERDYLESLVKTMKTAIPDGEFFIPMEHIIPNGEKLKNITWAKKVFDMDVKALSESDLVVALYLGHYSDTGTAWEIGYAYAKQIPIWLFIPPEYQSLDMSIMPINGCSRILQLNNIESLNQK